MRIRDVTISFADAIGDVVTELDFGPDDTLTVRPLFVLPREEANALLERKAALEEQAEAAAKTPRGSKERAKAEQAGDQFIVDLIGLAITGWRLDGPDGPIQKPATTEQLNALPAGLAAALYPFLLTFRGRDPNRTSRS